MKVLAVDPFRQAVAAESVRYVPLDELMRESHIISLHAPLTAETFHLLDRAAFAQCQRGPLIINTARGAIIDTDALVEALDAGIVRGAELDVLEEESVMRNTPARSSLIKLSSAFTTRHLRKRQGCAIPKGSSRSKDSFARKAAFAAKRRLHAARRV